MFNYGRILDYIVVGEEVDTETEVTVNTTVQASYVIIEYTAQRA